MNESPSLNTETRLPRQVRERGERARQALMKSDDEPQIAVPPVEPAAAPAPAAPEPPKEPAPVGDPRESDPAYWKQRFMSVDGLWRQDRIRHKEQLRQRDEQIVNLQSELDKAMSGSAAADPRLEDHFSSEELEAMDENARTAASVALRAAARTTSAQVEKVKASTRKSAEDKAKEEAAETERVFFSELTRLVPDWPEINKDEGWLQYLGQINDDGDVRQDVLDRRHAEWNAPAVAKIFTAYKSSKAAAVAPTPVPPPPAPPVMPTAATGGGGPADSNPPPADKPPTQSEIRDFYKRAAIGKISAAERQAFEARLTAHYGGARG